MNQTKKKEPIIQTGVIRISGSGSGTHYFNVTFPKAFSSIPKVFITKSLQNASLFWAQKELGILGETTTGFRIWSYSDNSSAFNYDVNWLAICI